MMIREPLESPAVSERKIGMLSSGLTMGNSAPMISSEIRNNSAIALCINLPLPSAFYENTRESQSLRSSLGRLGAQRNEIDPLLIGHGGSPAQQWFGIGPCRMPQLPRAALDDMFDDRGDH